MVKFLFPTLLLCFLAAQTLFGQTADPVLFTVKNTPVQLSEFKYIYSKTNQDKADFSRPSLQEYLDLYVKFKLKVQKAREMRLDTIEALRTELDGYRRQLANSYLIDREVTDKLIRETYERMGQDVDLSHIFIACDRNAKAADTLAAYTKAMEIYKLATAPGANFNQLATEKSEDKSAKDNHGDISFVTAMFPDGFYLMEKAAYAAKPGAIFGPVRTFSGYHIVRVNGFRPARGEMEIAQILLRKDKDAAKNATIQAKADSVLTALRGGASWDELCTKYSDDKMTAPKGGYIGFFGINRYQRNFEDAAFALKTDGEISGIVETSLGWHIIKRVSARPVLPFDQMKRPLTEKVKRDSRSEVAKQSMISKIKREGGFSENKAVLDAWAARQVDTMFLTFKWKPAEPKATDVLVKFASKTYSLGDFEEYCARASRERMRGAGTPMLEVISKLYKSWTDDVTMQFEESQLDKKYPDFKALMREYEEGILLFDATKQLVWDRANTDTTGLEAFFKNNLKDKYKWDERASVTFYTVKTDDGKVVAEVRELAAKKDTATVLKKMNKKSDLVSALGRQYEKGKNKDLNDIWTAGAMTAPKSDAGTKTTSFIKIESIAPPAAKTLNEARGYAVADYQDWLEKQWIEDLRKEFPVTIDQQVFEGMIKK